MANVKAIVLVALLILLATVISCAPAATPSTTSPSKPTPTPATTPEPTPSQKVMVGETKILEREMTEWGKPTGKFEKWQIALNWYIWEGDKVTVNIKVTNIMQEKSLTPSLSAVDSAGNYGDAVWGVQDAYYPKEIWPGQENSGSETFQFGPLSKGVKLYVHFFMETEQRVEFSLGR